MASADAFLSKNAGSDPWVELRRHTSARIALGRAGGSQRTAPLLDFRLSHARARDAVQAPFDPEAMAGALSERGIESTTLSTAAADRATYLARPDLGRKLSEASRRELLSHLRVWGPRDLLILVSDGLSALGAHRQAPAVLERLAARLRARGWSLYPVLIVPLARVKLQDQAGSLLGARQSLILLGERPGLGSPDSLGAYFTWKPSEERSDADRNCISNIRPDGLQPAAAADRLAALLEASAAMRASGVSLKDGSSQVRLGE